MHAGFVAWRRVSAIAVVTVALACAVAVSPAAGATRRPPCTKRALKAGLKRGANKTPGGKIDVFGCAGRFAYAAVTYKGIELTQLFSVKRGRWVTVDRLKPCEKKIVPKKIYGPACLTS